MAGLEKFENLFKIVRDALRSKKKLLTTLAGSLTLSYVAAVVVNSLAMSMLLDGAYGGQKSRRGSGGDVGSVNLSLGPGINYHDIRKAIEDRNVFNSDGEFPDEEETRVEATNAEKASASDFNLDAPCGKTSLKLTLLGTIYMGSGSSVATIQEQGYSESDVYKEGDEIIGQEAARIARIERQRVIINNNGAKECLELVQTKAPESNSGFGDVEQVSAEGAAPTPPPLEPGATTECELQEKFVQDQLGPGFGTIIQKARLVPNTVENQVNGFKIFAIEGNSLFARAGLKNGDVITQVNDVSLKQPEQGFALYQAFQDETEIRINVLRNGNTPVMITCRIK